MNSLSTRSALPIVRELDSVPDVMAALRVFAAEPAVLLFESARPGPLGRYSFLTADPCRLWQIDRPAYGVDPFGEIRATLGGLTAESVAGLPPFQGGAAGLLSYELGGAWERIPLAATDEFRLPAMAVGLYDWVIAWDHAADRAWIISQGFPETEAGPRADRARQRLEWVLARLNGEPASRSSRIQQRVAGVGAESSERSPQQTAPSRFAGGSQSLDPSHPPLPPERFAPQFPLAGHANVTSNFPRDGYLRAVERVIEYIRAGDIFQANLSQRLLAPLVSHPIDLYQRLRRVNAAPFAGYFACDDWAVVSASPERFLQLSGDEVETRPIKGTRRRRPIPEADLYTRDELRESEKDQAENVMIVDLLRNDLSRVCRPGSLRVPQLCTVETYETVQHLVSEVRGTLRPGTTAWDLFAATFPGGSITGAPKVRAMEIIAELEPTVRGLYCGSLFYCGFDGTMDSSILIRTFTCRHGWIQCPVGGGIVAQSDPKAEYDETLHKAEGMLRALGES